MRIVSGKWRGKRIVAPKNLPTRPTTDFAKEALFNVLNNRFYFEGKRVLDLFAGTGNISYEFLSRGVEDLTAVDQDRNCIKFITKTAQELGADIHCVQSDALQMIRRASTAYDIIFADPPYDFPHYEALAKSIVEHKLLRTGGEAIIEHSAQTDLSELPGFFEVRRYGTVHFSFFQIDEPSP